MQARGLVLRLSAGAIAQPKLHRPENRRCFRRVDQGGFRLVDPAQGTQFFRNIQPAPDVARRQSGRLFEPIQRRRAVPLGAGQMAEHNMGVPEFRLRREQRPQHGHRLLRLRGRAQRLGQCHGVPGFLRRQANRRAQRRQLFLILRLGGKIHEPNGKFL